MMGYLPSRGELSNLPCAATRIDSTVAIEVVELGWNGAEERDIYLVSDGFPSREGLCVWALLSRVLHLETF